MKELKLIVNIHKPVKDVFEFTTNPAYTPEWIDSVVKEVSNSYPPQLGTIYQNWNGEGDMNEYVVTQYEPSKVFQLDATHQDYKVRYTYTVISENETKLEYYEWSELDKLYVPFKQEILDKLKSVMEEQSR